MELRLQNFPEDALQFVYLCDKYISADNRVLQVGYDVFKSFVWILFLESGLLFLHQISLG